MFVKPVKIEGLFNFRFGTGKEENLIINFTEFVDSKVYSTLAVIAGTTTTAATRSRK
jgi:hypothetical protein